MIAVTIILIVLSSGISFFIKFISTGGLINPTEFDSLLNQLLGIVVGIELVKMLVKHTPGSIVEVLLFAIAREMIVAHDNMLGEIIGVTAIAGLFAIRKYLYVSSFKDETEKDS